jgi:hypothetical protein
MIKFLVTIIAVISLMLQGCEWLQLGKYDRNNDKCNKGEIRCS